MFEANINIHYFTASPSHLYKPHEPRVGLFGGSVVLPRQKRGCFSGGRATPRSYEGMAKHHTSSTVRRHHQCSGAISELFIFNNADGRRQEKITQRLNMDYKVEQWLKSINSNLSISDGVCNIRQKDLNIDFSLYFVDESQQLTLIGPFYNVNDGDLNILLGRALTDNANSSKMEGCWIGLINNEFVLFHSRDVSALDQIGFMNLINHFSLKIDCLKKEYSSNNQIGETVNQHNVMGILV